MSMDGEWVLVEVAPIQASVTPTEVASATESQGPVARASSTKVPSGTEALPASGWQYITQHRVPRTFDIRGFVFVSATEETSKNRPPPPTPAERAQAEVQQRKDFCLALRERRGMAANDRRA